MLYRQINDCAAHFNSANTYGSSLSGLAELWKVNGIMKCIAAKVLLTIQDLQSSWCLLIATWFLKLIFLVIKDPNLQSVIFEGLVGLSMKTRLMT